jgi:hypothetical protein
MPSNVVKTSRDERLWAEAKAQAHKEGFSIEKHGKRYWKYVMGIFKKMKG